LRRAPRFAPAGGVPHLVEPGGDLLQSQFLGSKLSHERKEVGVRRIRTPGMGIHRGLRSGQTQRLDNPRVLTGGAKYGQPAIQQVFDVE
jgi:hypothetical protein